MRHPSPHVYCVRKGDVAVSDVYACRVPSWLWTAPWKVVSGRFDRLVKHVCNTHIHTHTSATLNFSPGFPLRVSVVSNLQCSVLKEKSECSDVAWMMTLSGLWFTEYDTATHIPQFLTGPMFEGMMHSVT